MCYNSARFWYKSAVRSADVCDADTHCGELYGRQSLLLGSVCQSLRVLIDKGKGGGGGEYEGEGRVEGMGSMGEGGL